MVDPTDVEYLVTLLEQAVRRVELENRAGNPILSAWADDARQAIKDFDGDAAPARRFLSEMAAINLEATLTRKPAPELPRYCGYCGTGLHPPGGQQGFCDACAVDFIHHEEG